VDSAERVLIVLLAVALAGYIVSYLLRDYWSALSSAILVLMLAIIIVERRCRRWCEDHVAQQGNC
jgi:uncharacterized membrane protein YjjP (DUF1212 family)